jgi:hypothetical protein
MCPLLEVALVAPIAVPEVALVAPAAAPLGGWQW